MKTFAIVHLLAAYVAIDLVDAFVCCTSSVGTGRIGQRSNNNVLLPLSSTTMTDADVLSDPMFEPLSKPPPTVPNGKSPDELITIAKRFLLTSKGLGGDPDMLASSFTFEGPVVGPLTKDAFVTAIGLVDFALHSRIGHHNFMDFTSIHLRRRVIECDILPGGLVRMKVHSFHLLQRLRAKLL